MLNSPFSSLVVAITIASTHFVYPQRDDQAELAWVAWLNTKMVYPRMVTHLSINPAELLRVTVSTYATTTVSVHIITGVCTDRQLAISLIYLASDAAPRRGRLRSANRNCLTVPRCQLSTYGCRAFNYAGLTVWNLLPDELRNSDSFDSFKRFMKTILFSRY